MLALITGTPGAGKTLWTVSTVDKKSKDEGRPVFYVGISDVTLEDWHELDDPLLWADCPEGSLIVFDEAYGKDLFPAVKPGSERPPHVEAMATHRHRGHDVYVICQHSTQIDTFVRKMAAEHHHFKRLFGSERSTHYKWMELANERDKWERKEAQTETFRYPKDYYGTYKSTSLNTAKPSLPWKKLAIMAAGFVAIPVLLFVGVSAVWPDDDQQPVAQYGPPFESTVLTPLMGPPGPDEHIQNRPLLYASETNKPEIDDIPYSAMLYDALVVPVSYPRVSGCMRMTYSDGRDVCRCNSQQGDVLDISYRACLDYIKNGWFDFSEPDPEEELEPARTNDGPPLISTSVPGQGADGVAPPGS